MPVDLSGPIYAEFERTLARAKLKQDAGANVEAAAAYGRCGELMTQYAEYAASDRVRERRLQRAQLYRNMAKQVEVGPVSVAEGGPATGSSEFESQVTALIQKSTMAWDDIGGLQETKREIKIAYVLSLAQKPAGVQVGGWRNMLFYGPPGCGKTLLAAATSNGLDATFFNVKVSSLLSKYFGESTRLISTLYKAARKLAPAVIFLDEFESLGSQRDTGQSGAEMRIVSTLLAELDGMAQKDDDRYVLTIAATNLPWLVDKAILSRFEKKIFIPLPDRAAREQILSIHTDRRGYESRVSLGELARRTAGFTGREIERLCKEAIAHMVQAANVRLVELVDRGQDAVREYELRIQSLSTEDWEHAFGLTEPETGPQDLAQFERWRSAG